MDMNTAVAKAINAERGAANMTIKVLAEKSGVPERTLIRLLKAERDIKVDQLSSIAGVFGISPAHLIKEAEEFQAREEARKDALAVHMAQNPDKYELAADDLTEEEKRRDELGDAYAQEDDDGSI